MAKKKRKMGAPRRPFDWQFLDSLLTLRAPLDYCCSKLLEREGKEINSKSIAAKRKFIERRVRERFECTFVEYREQKMEPLRQGLFQKQCEVALGGNTTMLIWLGKQELGQRDKSDIDVNEKAAEKLSDQELIEEVRKVLTQDSDAKRRD